MNHEPIKAGDMLLDSINNVGMVISVNPGSDIYRVQWSQLEAIKTYWKFDLTAYRINWTEARKRYIKNK